MNIVNHYIFLHSVLKYSERFVSVSNMDEAVTLILKNQLKAEIIGHWLYCFTTDLVGVQLLANGFWYSFKHCAFVYSGNPKECPADDETLDEIRARLGSRPLRG